MSRNIDQFIKEVRDYINTFIADKENSVIENCPETDLVTNRGHAIPVTIKKNEELSEMTKGVSPLFYAEELLKKYPKSTVAAIAESINAEVNIHYQKWIRIMKIQSEAANKSIDDFGEDIILSALPTSSMNNHKAKDSMILKERPELGITMVMKGAMCDYPEGKGLKCYMTLSKKEERPVTDEDWDRAEKGSLLSSRIEAGLIPVVLEDGTFIPVCGQIEDTVHFYDFFYLLSPEKIWGSIADKFDLDRVYILPIGAHAAYYFIDSQNIRDHEEAQTLRSSFLDKAVEAAGVLPEDIAKAYVVDCATMQVTKFKEGTKKNGEEH